MRIEGAYKGGYNEQYLIIQFNIVSLRPIFRSVKNKNVIFYECNYKDHHNG